MVPTLTYMRCYQILLTLGLLSWGEMAFAQRYRLASSQVSFFSEAPMENIAARTEKAQSLFDPTSAEIAFVIPIRSFQFKKSLMQKHFNENYLESEQYPNASFEGKLSNFSAASTEAQTVTARGKFTIHGVTHDVDIPGEVLMRGDSLLMQAAFPIKLEDYDIKIPKVVFYNIAEVVDVNVQFSYLPDEK